MKDLTATRLLSAREAAEVLSVPLARLYELVRENRLPAVRIGRSVRVHPRTLDAWIEAGGTRTDS